MTQPHSTSAATRIGQFFAEDHVRLDALFADLRSGLSDGITASDPGTAVHLERLRQFHTGLDRHIRWEEEILFPAVEAKEPGLEHGPGRVMRIEHADIRQLLEDATACLTGADLPGALAALDGVAAILQEHNGKEEMIYYPMADQLLDPTEVTAVLARVEAMP